MGNPLTETYTDTNFSGIDNSNNYTGYTWDEVLDLYFAQNRFYDPADHRFTQEDPIKDGENWYAYCGNNPCIIIDVSGLDSYIFYDPVMFDNRDMKKYAEMMQKDVKKKFGGTVHNSLNIPYKQIMLGAGTAILGALVMIRKKRKYHKRN